MQGILSPQNSEARTSRFLAVAVGLDGRALGKKEEKHKRERKEGLRVPLYAPAAPGGLARQGGTMGVMTLARWSTAPK